MRRRHPARSLLGACALAAGLALLAAGCGGGGSTTGAATESTTAAPTSTTSARGKTFPSLRIAYDTGIDFLDPGLAVTAQATQILWNVYLPLIGYKHVNGPAGGTLVPYLAEALPTVSADGRTYAMKLRQGLTYSDGSPVEASDFKATIERDFKIESTGVRFFGNVVGANEFARTKKGHISGIKVNNRSRRITIELRRRQADFMNVLATNFAAPLPAATPAKDQSSTPAPATGPYVIQSYKPGKLVVVARNPTFYAALLDHNVPRGNPDTMTMEVVGSATAALQRVIKGEDDYTVWQPPPALLGDIEAKYADQMKVSTQSNTYYFFMNHRLRPFSDKSVREAVNYGIDRSALVELYGGLAAPTENLLPPTYAQYRRIGRYPYDLAKAKQLVQASGMASEPIVVWGPRRNPDAKASAYLADQLRAMGFTDVRQKIVSAAIYWSTIGNQATRSQIGFAAWFQDLPHPVDWFDGLVNGAGIKETHNFNYGNVDVPEVNRTIVQLKKAPLLNPRVNAGWASVDRMLADDSAVAPFLNRRAIDFFSAGMELRGSCYVNHLMYSFDYAQACKK